MISSWIPWIALAAGAEAALLLDLWAHRAGARDRSEIGDPAVLERMARLPRAPWRLLRGLALGAGTGLLAASAFLGGRSPATDDGSRETVLVLDASNSMRAADVEPDRLARQRTLARELVARAGGRFGVVAFAGRAWALSPLTRDRSAVLMFVDAVDPELVGRGGTSLASAVRQGTDVLAGGAPGARRALVLFSDGEATTDSAELGSALDRAVQAGVAIHVVGIGTPEGGRVPSPRPESTAAPPGPWMIAPDGAPVLSRLDEEGLRSIARATGGLYVPGTEGGLAALLRRLPSAGGRPGRDPLTPAGLALLGAFALLFAEAYLFRRG
jgi:Ca-activated chloride channel family protein